MFVHDNYTLLRLIGTLLLSALASSPAAGHQVESTQPVIISTTPLMAAGTVTELTVSNELTGVTQRYLGIKLDQGTSYALTGVGLDTLSNGSRVNASGTVAGNVFNVDAFSVVARAGGAVRKTALSQTQKTVSGTLAIHHKDYFAEGRGEYGLAVASSAGQMTLLNVAVIPDAVRPGMTVSVSGTTAADGVSLDASQITILGLPPAQTDATGGAPITNNVLVMPIKFTDSAANDPFTPAQIDQVMRTNTNSVAAYYNEVSYGQQQLNITVAHTASGGWLQAGSAFPANCDYNAVGALADQAATAAGYNLANYKNRYYVMPNVACAWAGLAYVGYPYQAWSNGYNALWVYGHELGHNFTLWHAGANNCGAQVLGGICNVAEYGDRFGGMGNNGSANEQMHFNAAQKSLLNWIPASSVKTHTSGTSTYNLSPLELGGQTTYAVKIPVAADPSRTYWIEYRQPIGFDSGIAAYPNNGAQIRVASPFDYWCGPCGGDDTEMLDMTPGSAGGFYDAALLVGQTYTDSLYGISVTVNSATSSALNLTVNMGGGAATTTTLATSGSPSVVGANVTFTATVNGSAPTGSVAFTSDGTTLSGCGAVALPTGSANSKAATCSSSSLATGTHSIVATYAGGAGNNGSTSATWPQVVKTASSTTLSSSGTPSLVGASVTFTATVAGTAPTGAVAFTDGGGGISGCSAIGLPAGSANSKIATCSTSSLSAGTHSIVATYAGDAGNNASSSTTWSQVVSTLVGGKRADFNGDGKADTLWRQASTGSVQMWLMNGPSIISASSIGGGTDWSIAGAGDFNGDGKGDILWRQASTGSVQMWLMNGPNIISASTIGGGTDWSIAGVGDFNGDGKADILWRQASTGSVQMWLMNGPSIISASSIGGGTDWSIAGVGDFNGDGKADILWRQASTGSVQMWLMNGPSIISASSIGGGTDWSIAGVGDFNGDGKADILWLQVSKGSVQMWLMNGPNTISASTVGAGTDWSTAGVGDFNGDGKADILWRQASNGSVQMWLMNGPSIISASNIGGGTDWSIAAPK